MLQIKKDDFDETPDDILKTINQMLNQKTENNPKEKEENKKEGK